MNDELWFVWVQGVKKVVNGDGALQSVMNQKKFMADKTTGTEIDTEVKELLL